MKEPSEWATHYVQSSENALSFLVSMTSEVHVSSSRGSSSYKELDVKNVDTFVDAKLLEEKLSPYLADAISPEHQAEVQKHGEVIEAAKQAFANRDKAQKNEQIKDPGQD